MKRSIFNHAWLLASISLLLCSATGYSAALTNSARPYNPSLYDQYPWAMTYYTGVTTSDALVRMFQGDFHRWPERVQSLELTHTLEDNDRFRLFFKPLVNIVQLSMNVTYRHGSNEHNILELDPYIDWRWDNLPWNNYVNTSLAIGEGISYGSSVPSLERQANADTKRLLNYLMLEATFALPNYPRLQLVTRIHHRSGAYGLYRAGNTGSNNVGLGIRFLFD